MPFRRVAALYDIHGNLPALEAVLEALAAHQPDLIVIGGDALSGPCPLATLGRLEELPTAVSWLQGNCERAMVEAFDGVRDPSRHAMDTWSASCLDRAARDRMAHWPKNVVVEVVGLGRVHFCHGSPRSDSEMLTVRTPESRLAAALHGVPEAIVVCGHTHMRFERTIGAQRVLNAGSVGMPYGAPGAHWLLLGPAVRPMTTQYDRRAAREVIRHSGWLGAADFAEAVLNPPSAEEALDAFEPLPGGAAE